MFNALIKIFITIIILFAICFFLFPAIVIFLIGLFAFIVIVVIIAVVFGNERSNNSQSMRGITHTVASNNKNSIIQIYTSAQRIKLMP